MLSSRYQISLKVLNFDKTAKVMTLRPAIYNNVTTANSAAVALLRESHCARDEIVRVMSENREGMRVFGVSNLKLTVDHVSAWARVVRVEE